jgi:alpha-tubulin suppressor-like RCC1 family protein
LSPRDRALFVVGLFIGCYAPEREDCRVRCDAQNRCPWDMSCSNDRCASPGKVCPAPEDAPEPEPEPPEPEPGCAVSATRCVSPGRFQRCLSDGHWGNTQDCFDPNPVCSLGMCRPCALGIERCDGASHVQRCDGDDWSAAEVCPEDRPVCKLSRCVSAYEVSSGSAHVCALDTSGTVRCWGDGSRGALGLGDLRNRGDRSLPPGRVGLRSVLAIDAGGSHTCAVLGDRTLRCWGNNSSGQLGQGDTDTRGDEPDEVERLPAIELGDGVDIVEISAGLRHTCALLQNGSVKCWGDNSLGQLGVGDTEARGDEPGEMGQALPAVELGGSAVSISAGEFSTCAVLTNGDARCWGRDFIVECGRILGDSPAEVADSQVASGESPFSRVAVGSIHACTWPLDGPVSCWGRSRGGQLGTAAPSPVPRVVDLSRRKLVTATVGPSHSCAVLEGEVQCWGVNQFGALGLGRTDIAIGDTYPENGEPSELDGLGFVDLTDENGVVPRVTDISAGDNFTCAVLDGASVKCWGANQSGQLGLGDTLPRGEAQEDMGRNLRPVPLDD